MPACLLTMSPLHTMADCSSTRKPMDMLHVGSYVAGWLREGSTKHVITMHSPFQPIVDWWKHTVLWDNSGRRGGGGGRGWRFNFLSCIILL